MAGVFVVSEPAEKYFLTVNEVAELLRTTRKSIWNEPAMREPKYEYMKAVIDGWSANSFLVPTECNTARFDADWNQAVQRVIVGGKTPKEAMQEAEKSFLSRQ